MRVSVPSLLIVLVSSLVPLSPTMAANGQLRVSCSFPSARSQVPLDGRMLLMISKDGSKEPRFQINDGANGQLIFGIDVNGLKPEAEAIFDGKVLGFPLRSLDRVPSGE